MQVRNVARAAKQGFTGIALLASAGALGAGCLSRPVQPGQPTTKTNYTSSVKASGIDKVDILFAIDNSASMGDKQELLRLAVPDLVNRLVNPFCVSETDGKIVGPSRNGECTSGKAEFPPVYDMHIGIVTSSLGGRTASECQPGDKNPTDATLDRHNDDQAHLINRAGAKETAVASAGTSNFLAWLPNVDKNADKPAPGGGVARLTDLAQFQKDFQDLVSGVHEYGCGFEAQLESVYRFLNQPDPYEKILPEPRQQRPTFDTSAAQLSGIDRVILQQRKDFLRPDSLVAVIMITDENDSTVDPLAYNGQGWRWLNRDFPGSQVNGQAPRGTSICATNPTDPKCTSCAFTKLGNGQPNPDVVNDPNCQQNGGYYDPIDDDLNVRPILMKKRFGADPQFPLTRYIAGFKELLVPNRNGEHPIENGVPSRDYKGTATCTNPIFADALPDPSAIADEAKAIDETLCKLTPSSVRRPDSNLVFFAVIGGAPWQLLSKNYRAGMNLNEVQLKDELTDEDWGKLIGRDPAKYDYEGQDPHMVEAFEPRAAITAGPNAPDDADPFHGREWDTAQKKDLEYSCTFPLPKTDALPNGRKDCTAPEFKDACDCHSGRTPPLCDVRNTGAGDPAAPAGEAPGAKPIQVRGKAYPTIREYAVVRALGTQGIVSSICPIKVEDFDADGKPTKPGAGTDPLFGYRPAVKQIIDRLKNALSFECLPQALSPDQTGLVPCLILETLGQDGPQSQCKAAEYPNRSEPDQKILDKFREQQRAQEGGGGDGGGGGAAAAGSLTKRPVCQLKQLTSPAGGSCKESSEAGWCYVEGDGARKASGGKCRQMVLFTESASRAKGSTFSLQCIRSSESAADAGAAPSGS